MYKVSNASKNLKPHSYVGGGKAGLWASKKRKAAIKKLSQLLVGVGCDVLHHLGQLFVAVATPYWHACTSLATAML